ncbi:nucleolar complex protein 14 [Dinochytrium kinnereticum]|nr:nucleolar complex protein 14 [Dinochytrium kinnereticum]
MPEKKSGGSAIRSLKELVKDKRINNKKRLNTDKSKPSTKRVNPFELQFSRAKHDVLGRKMKGVAGKPLLKRKVAEETRSKTLAVELAKKSRVAKFVDRRFGENDPTMSLEDKMMERFMKERQSKSDRRSNFNLEEDELTHLGKSLSSFDDLNDGFDDFDGMDDQIDASTVSMAHFGNFDDENGERKKSRNEIMQEVIAKSKAHKFERQQQNEEVHKLTEEVDTDLDLVRSLLMNKEAADERKYQKFEADDYDRQVKEMLNEARSKPSNRTKSEEEAALERKAHLEELEARRMERMTGLYNSENGVRAPPRKSQADDLGDYTEPEADLHNPLEYRDGVLSNYNDSADTDEAISKPSPAAKGRNREQPRPGVPLQEDKALDMIPDADLPFVFDFPESFSGLKVLLYEKTAKDQEILVRRLRDLYHVKLNPGNRLKLKALLEYLLEYILSPAHWGDNFEVTRAISSHVYELSYQFPDAAATLFRGAVDKMHTALVNSKGQDVKSSITVREILLLKLIGRIFSVSDLEHCISSLAINTICQYLSLSVPSANKSSAIGVACCDVLIEYHKDSRRYIPEAIRFLQKLVASLIPKIESETTASTDPIPAILSICSMRKPVLTALDTASLFLNAVRCLKEFAVLYHDHAAYIEIFSTVIQLLDQPPPSCLPESAQKSILDATSEIKRLYEQCLSKRKPLTLLQLKAVAIETYAPRFDVNYSLDRKQDFNRERSKMKKLKNEYQREFKGAVRELRKDGKFIARKRLEEKTEESKRYKKKMDSILGALANQEGAMRGMEKMKKKQRL